MIEFSYFNSKNNNIEKMSKWKRSMRSLRTLCNKHFCFSGVRLLVTLMIVYIINFVTGKYDKIVSTNYVVRLKIEHFLCLLKSLIFQMWFWKFEVETYLIRVENVMFNMFGMSYRMFWYRASKEKQFER